MMAFRAPVFWVRALGILFLVQACGGSAGVEDGSDTCKALFGEQCGQACDSETPCSSGLHCQDGKCHAECGDGVSCSGDLVCTTDGRCSSGLDINDDPDSCGPQTCEEAGFGCGLMVDKCGKLIDCAEEGLACEDGQICVGNPTECVTGTVFGDCEVCSGIPDCSGEAQPTILRGRVVSPGRSDDDTGNQVGIPNAVVYILRSTDYNELPVIPTGIPAGESRCDRCEDHDYGPLLAGAVTDATGYFEIEEFVPVDTEFLLVVQAGKFRRATPFTLPADAACSTTTLPTSVEDGNPTRLPRRMDDGLAVNIPHIAISTGQLDAMECVFFKMGIDESEFSRPALDGRIHLYRSNGAWPDQQSQSCNGCTGGGSGACRQEHCEWDGTGSSADARNDFLDALADDRLYEDDGRIFEYDLAVFDCEGSNWDSTRSRASHNVREYVNGGGRMFASHLSFTWLHDSTDANGTTPYDPDEPLATGLGPAATWQTSAFGLSLTSGTGRISIDPDERPHASSRIQDFADWMESEGVASAPDFSFTIEEPRSQVLDLGSSSEEFVYCDGDDCSEDNNAIRTQQFSFNTPYGAPEAAACGRVAYSGFHVSVGNSSSQVFPAHCGNNGGELTDQEKILLYMLFDLGACVGDPPVIPCIPATCPDNACGLMPNGCGGVVDCGACVPVPVR